MATMAPLFFCLFARARVCFSFFFFSIKKPRVRGEINFQNMQYIHPRAVRIINPL